MCDLICDVITCHFTMGGGSHGVDQEFYKRGPGQEVRGTEVPQWSPGQSISRGRGDEVSQKQKQNVKLEHVQFFNVFL